jgi:undecaprenyl-diphosphatase
MNIFEAIILGIIQGLSEWLPISSSGHLVLAHYFFNFEYSADFDIFLMLGTTLALILYFHKRLLELFFGLLKFKKEEIKFIFFIFIAGLTTFFLGYPLKNFFKSFFSAPFFVCIFLILNGLILILASKIKTTKTKFDFLAAVVVGLAQFFAIMPGLSRSGLTISSAIFLKIDKIKAAEFSFLLGIPSMFFASFFDFFESNLLVEQNFLVLASGFFSSFLAGYLSIYFFMELLKKGKLYWFGIYCILIGLLAALLIFFK